MKKSNSAIFFPSIPSTSNASLNRSVFMTITDDVGFTKMQIDKINESIKNLKEKELKPWQKSINNNIYSCNGKTNYHLIKELNKKFKIIKNDKDIKSINWSKQNYYNKKQLNNIFDGYNISKRVINNFEVKKKCRERSFEMDAFISQTRNISLDNLKINLIKNEREKIQSKHVDYQKALDYEKKSLEKDVEDFNNFKLEVNTRLKEDEKILYKYIQENKLLFERHKQLSQEYKYIVEEIMRYIKIIISYKHYGIFIHKLLGGDSKVLNIKLDEKVNFKGWTEKDLNKYIKKVIKELNIFMTETTFDEKTVEILSDNKRLENLFKILEENILKIVKENAEYEKEEEKIMEEDMTKYNKLLSDYNNKKIRYELYLKELEQEKSKIKGLVIDPELSDYYSEMNKLLEDLCNYSCNINMGLNINDINIGINSFNKTTSTNSNGTETEFFFGRSLKGAIQDLKKKEFLIEDLIKEIEEAQKKDPQLIKIIVSEVRRENRITKTNEERKIKQIEEFNKRKKVINKIEQNFVRQRCKFRELTPYHILKQREKYLIKGEKDTPDSNLLFY